MSTPAHYRHPFNLMPSSDRSSKKAITARDHMRWLRDSRTYCNTGERKKRNAHSRRREKMWRKVWSRWDMRAEREQYNVTRLARPEWNWPALKNSR